MPLLPLVLVELPAVAAAANGSTAAVSGWTDAAQAIGSVIAALGTVGTLAVVIWQRHQERAAARARDRRAQAERVSGWLLEDGEHGTPLRLSNRSEEPIYRAVVSLVLVQGAGPRTGLELRGLDLAGYQRFFSVIPPGVSRSSLAGGWAGMGRRPGLEIAFTDRAGVHWVRFADGSLTEVASSPPEYYELPMPLPWELPTTEDR